MTRAQFTKGIVACLAVMIAMFGALYALNHGHNRPEGVAEDWLTAIGDTTRKGVEADSTRRADEIGGPELARNVLWGHPEDINRKAGFEDLEVGKAQRINPANADIVRVGFRVNARRPEKKTKEIEGVLTLEKVDDKWHISALDEIKVEKAGLPALPSAGGPPPASAPVSLWVGAIIGSALIGVILTGLVKAAGRTTAAAAAA